MRNVFLFIFVAFLSFACENENAATKNGDALETKDSTFRIVTQSEYDNASITEQKLYDNIKAAADALMDLDEKYTAVISINQTNLSDPYSGIIIFQEPHSDAVRIKYIENSCTICGVSSAYKCLKELREIESDTFDIHVSRKGSCVILTWET
ncbi:hypothetical protein [Flavobacterium cerinum]|uniref:Uncharacterized protein n=1 Tax=Flavobacterium cerinum TaxID=2502784 RepID=A0ABY5IR63_9FLAO|nr:hypothetical protein [Flavobacterium cerinum]UUC44268.1 hypothetical protein NOX80_11555 [Flavobacterium cerinum]